jgi:hypothetical protein
MDGKAAKELNDFGFGYRGYFNNLGINSIIFILSNFLKILFINCVELFVKV